MSNFSDGRACKEPECDKPAGKGMTQCWAHYQRTRRGSKTQTAPVREYGLGVDLLSPPALAPQVTEMMRRAAEQLSTEEVDGSMYAVEKRIFREWADRYKSGVSPYLCGERAITDPVLSVTGYSVQGISGVPMVPADLQALRKYQEECGRTTSNVLLTIFDDWYLWWSENETPPPGKTSLSPYPSKDSPRPSPKARAKRRPRA